MTALRSLLALAALATVPALAPATAHAASLTSDLRALSHEAGGRGGFAVLDGRTGRTLAASGDRGVHPLGSTTKVITTATALDVVGRDAALTTTVLAAGAVDATGTLTGDLMLQGGGDPLLGEAGLATLAGAVQAAGIATVTGSVVGDESLFDALRGGPATGGAFDLNIGGALGALTYDRGRQVPGGPIQADPARAAAFRFDDVLEARGLTIRGGPRSGPTPAGATPLGVASTPLPAIVKAINKTSDDFGAEIVTKEVGARAAGAGTTAAGAAVISGQSGFTLVDGSGVDEHSRGSARALARFVRAHRLDPVLAASLPVAGIDGTLEDRMTRGRARGRCRAKTGSLPQHRVSALAGWCTDRGRTSVFAFLREGVDSESSAKAVDRWSSACSSAAHQPLQERRGGLDVAARRRRRDLPWTRARPWSMGACVRRLSSCDRALRTHGRERQAPPRRGVVQEVSPAGRPRTPNSARSSHVCAPPPPCRRPSPSLRL